MHWVMVIDSSWLWEKIFLNGSSLTSYVQLCIMLNAFLSLLTLIMQQVDYIDMPVGGDKWLPLFWIIHLTDSFTPPIYSGMKYVAFNNCSYKWTVELFA